MKKLLFPSPIYIWGSKGTEKLIISVQGRARSELVELDSQFPAICLQVNITSKLPLYFHKLLSNECATGQGTLCASWGQ